jgi:hypothetical protein
VLHLYSTVLLAVLGANVMAVLLAMAVAADWPKRTSKPSQVERDVRPPIRVPSLCCALRTLKNWYASVGVVNAALPLRGRTFQR